MRKLIFSIGRFFALLVTLSGCNVSIYVPCDSAASCSATGHVDSTLPISNQITTYTGMFWPTSNSGGLATGAQPNAPSDLVFDNSGNLYFADSANRVVRKITPAGIISTVAGNGTQGNSGDGGLAIAAKLNYPVSVAVDTSSNIYIADEPANVIRKVTAATGIITTIAGQSTAGYTGDGGPASAAKLNGPYSLRFDASQNLYIADSQNGVIRKIANGTSIITTVAGNGTPGYSGDDGPATSAALSPGNIAISANGDIYISDLADAVIRKVTATNGIISTFAGNTQFGYAGDNGPATNANLSYPSALSFDLAGNVIFADQGNNTVRKVNVGTGIITTLAGDGNPAYNGDGGPATSAELNQPEGVGVDASGNVFIADTYNDVLREIKASTGNISTFAGVPVAGYYGDGGAATSASFQQPAGVAVDSEGNLYTVDIYSNVVRKTDAATGMISTVVGNGIQGTAGDGGPATSANLNYPQGVAVDGQGNLYVTIMNDGTVRKVDKATGIITTIAGHVAAGYGGDGGPATSAVMNNPYGIAVAASGNYYIADTGNYAIRKVNGSTGIITTVFGGKGVGNTGDGGPGTSAKLGGVFGVALDANENVYVADPSYGEVRMLSVATGIVTKVAGTGVNGYSGDGGPATSAQLNHPWGLALDPNGNIFVADTTNQVIRRIDATTGIIETVAGSGVIGFAGDGGTATAAQLNAPSWITSGLLGEYFICDLNNRVIRKVTP